MKPRAAEKHSDEIIDWLVELGYTHCFFLAGGNIMHLLDSARSRMTCIPVVHEVTAGIATEYFNQVSERGKAFALVTAGPGITNAVTAIAGAWLEHRDLLVIGGQVKSSDLRDGGLRQRGIQEIDGTTLVSSICKCVLRIDQSVAEAEFKRFVEAGSSGRPGPVFIEVCLDAQGSPPSQSARAAAVAEPVNIDAAPNGHAAQSAELIAKEMELSQRPVWILGAGLSREAARTWRHHLEHMGIPVVTTWHGADRMSSRADNYFGRMDTWGQRRANLIVNQADFVLALGARLGLQETGFNWQEFAPHARIVHVDIDQSELNKGHPRTDYAICADAAEILRHLIRIGFNSRLGWVDYCRIISDECPLNENSNSTGLGFVSPYDFYLEASLASREDDIWIPASSGGANSTAIQALNQWGDQKVVCDNGLASMGFGLAGAIGAAFGAPDRRIWLVEGDGSFAQNLQDLGTVRSNRLNVKTFIFSNDGYGSIRTTQRNYFGGAYVGCDEATGLGFPNWEILAAAYGIPFIEFPENGFADEGLRAALEEHGPLFVTVRVDPDQTYWPKISSRVTASGGMESNPLYRMSPDLDPSALQRVGRFLP